MERECTFAPVIDARSAGMMSHRSVVLKVSAFFHLLVDSRF